MTPTVGLIPSTPQYTDSDTERVKPTTASSGQGFPIGSAESSESKSVKADDDLANYPEERHLISAKHVSAIVSTGLPAIITAPSKADSQSPSATFTRKKSITQEDVSRLAVAFEKLREEQERQRQDALNDNRKLQEACKADLAKVESALKGEIKEQHALIESLNRTIREQDQTIKDLQQRVAELCKQRDALSENLKEANQQNTKLRDEYDAKEKLIKHGQQEIERLRQENERLRKQKEQSEKEAELAKMRAELATRTLEQVGATPIGRLVVRASEARVKADQADIDARNATHQARRDLAEWKKKFDELTHTTSGHVNPLARGTAYQRHVQQREMASPPSDVLAKVENATKNLKELEEAAKGKLKTAEDAVNKKIDHLQRAELTYEAIMDAAKRARDETEDKKSTAMGLHLCGSSDTADVARLQREAAKSTQARERKNFDGRVAEWRRTQAGGTQEN